MSQLDVKVQIGFSCTVPELRALIWACNHMYKEHPNAWRSNQADILKRFADIWEIKYGDLSYDRDD